jgi:hypothetical protein
MRANKGDILWSSVLPVDPSKAREIALALHTSDAEWKNLSADKLVGKAVMPTFTATASFWQDRLALLIEKLELRVERVLHGGHRWEYLRPLRVGDELFGVLRYQGYEDRVGGRGGRMEIHRLETTYTDSEHREVLKEEMILLHTAETVR